jgi:hypothetical protein
MGLPHDEAADNPGLLMAGNGAEHLVLVAPGSALRVLVS